MNYIKRYYSFFLCISLLILSRLLIASPAEFQWVSNDFESMFKAMSELDTDMLVVPHPGLDKEEVKQGSPEPVWMPRETRSEEGEKALKADFVKTMIRTHDYICFGRNKEPSEFFYGILQLDEDEQSTVCYFKNKNGQEYRSEGEFHTLLIRPTTAKWQSLLMKSGKALPDGSIRFLSGDFYKKLLQESQGSLLKPEDQKLLGTYMRLKKSTMFGVDRREKGDEAVEDIRVEHPDFQPVEEPPSSHRVQFEIVIEDDRIDLHNDPARSPYYVLENTARWVVVEKVWCTDNRYPYWNVVKNYRAPFPKGFIDRYDVYNRYAVLPFLADEESAKRIGLTLTGMEHLVSHAYASFYVVIRLNESRSPLGAWDSNLTFARGDKFKKDDSAKKRTEDIDEKKEVEFQIKKMVFSHGTVHRNKGLLLVTKEQLGFDPNELGCEKKIIDYVQLNFMTTDDEIQAKAQQAETNVRRTQLDEESRSYYQRMTRKSGSGGAAAQ